MFNTAKILTGREARREQSRQERKAFVQVPEWKKAEINRRAAKIEELERNGITVEQLEQNWKNGWNDCNAIWEKKYASMQKDFTEYAENMFFCAIALALRRKLKFGKERIYKIMETVSRIMIDEITTADILETCQRETGITIEQINDVRDGV